MMKLLKNGFKGKIGGSIWNKRPGKTQIVPWFLIPERWVSSLKENMYLISSSKKQVSFDVNLRSSN